MDSAQVEIGNPAQGVKVAQMISQVRSSKPDWLNFDTLVRTADSIIEGPAAKIKIPPGFTMQLMSNANYYLSNMVGGLLRGMGHIINQTSKGSSYALISTSSIQQLSNSVLAKGNLMFPDMVLKVGYLDSATRLYKEIDCTDIAWTQNMFSHVGPILTFRNDSGVNDIEFYVGTAPYQVDNTYAFQPTNAMFSFRLAPNAFLDSW